MATRTPVWKETFIQRLEGEVWKDIPGFEGYYQASSFGRIQSLDRIVPHPRLYQQSVKGRILRQSLHKNKNILGKRPMIDLRVSLNLNGAPHYFNVRRLVYSTFIKRINYAKDGMYVMNRDGNGYNNSVGNLVLATKSEKQKRAVKRKRIISYLSYADRSQWKTNGGMSRRKAVGKFSLSGELLEKYASVTEASVKMGLDTKAIIGVAKNRYSQWNGVVWKYLKLS